MPLSKSALGSYYRRHNTKYKFTPTDLAYTLSMINMNIEEDGQFNIRTMDEMIHDVSQSGNSPDPLTEIIFLDDKRKIPALERNGLISIDAGGYIYLTSKGKQFLETIQPVAEVP